MTQISLSIHQKDGSLKQGRLDPTRDFTDLLVSNQDFVYLASSDFIYHDGDYLEVTVDQANTFLVIKFDETLESSLVFVKDKKIVYPIHLTENAIESRSEARFLNKRHYLSVRKATPAEIASYRNWALNTHDQHQFNGSFPHASANVETRNDATFFACNAIDGVFANHSHGSYPYQSWGINQQLDAALTIDFGRPVEIDQITLTLRADFPHDSYWQQVTLAFSDGSKEIIQLKKTARPQNFTISKRIVDKIVMENMIQDTDPSPFPALTQIEVFGQNSEVNFEE
ncbi:hypothetical protein [Enterococcus sp. LJL90]